MTSNPLKYTEVEQLIKQRGGGKVDRVIVPSGTRTEMIRRLLRTVLSQKMTMLRRQRQLDERGLEAELDELEDMTGGAA